MNKKILLALAVLGVAAGCSKSTGKGLSVSTKVTSASPAAATNTVASGNVIDAGNGILISRIRVVVAKAEVEGPPACPTPATPPVTSPTGTMLKVTRTTPPLFDGDSGSGSGGDDGSTDDASDTDECEIEGGPFLVDLSGTDLTGGVHFAVGLDVPAGTYEEVKFKIDTISMEKAGTNDGLKAMADANASILVDGTMDGVAFQFSTPMALTQKREGALVVDETAGANVTIDFDASSWFKAADGSKLDPTDPTTQGAILANIGASIRVVSDDDHDGMEDGDHEGGGHD